MYVQIYIYIYTHSTDLSTRSSEFVHLCREPLERCCFADENLIRLFKNPALLFVGTEVPTICQKIPAKETYINQKRPAKLTYWLLKYISRALHFSSLALRHDKYVQRASFVDLYSYIYMNRDLQ